MTLTEYRFKHRLYFKDENDLKQGECKTWYSNGQPAEISHFRDGKLHGEYKHWLSSGKLIIHRFFMDGNKIIDFLESPELYPSTPESKTYFALKYNIGDAPFIKESLD